MTRVILGAILAGLALFASRQPGPEEQKAWQERGARGPFTQVAAGVGFGRRLLVVASSPVAP